MLNVYNYVHGVVPLIYLQPRSVLVYKLCKTRVQRVFVEEAVASQRSSGEALEGGVLQWIDQLVEALTPGCPDGGKTLARTVKSVKMSTS